MEGHAATARVLPLDLTNHLALIKTSDVTNIAGVSSRSKNRGAMRRWRSLFGKASRKAAFATNDSGRYWRRSGQGSLGVVERRFGDHTGPRIEDERCRSAKRQHASSEIRFSIACIVRRLASTATRHSMLRPGLRRSLVEARLQRQHSGRARNVLGAP